MHSNRFNNDLAISNEDSNNKKKKNIAKCAVEKIITTLYREYREMCLFFVMQIANIMFTVCIRSYMYVICHRGADKDKLIERSRTLTRIH